MKLLAAALALLGTIVPSASGARELARPAHAVGQRWSETRVLRDELSYRLERGGELVQSFHEVEGSSTSVELEVLRVDAHGLATKLALTFAHALRLETGNDVDDTIDAASEMREERLAIDSRSFDAELSGDCWTVFDADGRPANSRVRDLVLHQAEIVDGTFEPALETLARAIAARPRAVGQPLVLDEALARALIGRPDGLRSVAATLVARAPLERDVEALTHFDARVEIVAESASTDTWQRAATLSGEIVVDARTGACVSVELTGRSRVLGAVSSPDSALEVTADGPWSVSRRRIDLPRR